MITNMGSQKLKSNKLLWMLNFILIAGGIAGYYFFSQYSLLLRVCGLLTLAILVGFLAFQTKQGKYAWEQWQGSLQEVRKMVWPTKQETIHMTLAVLAMVVIMGILLWTTDYILLHTIAWLAKL